MTDEDSETVNENLLNQTFIPSSRQSEMTPTLTVLCQSYSSLSTVQEEDTPLLSPVESYQSFPSVSNSLSMHLTKEVLLNITVYAIWCLVIVVYDEVYILFVAEPVSHGGLGFTTFDIGLGISITGIVQLFAQLVIYPAMENRKMTQLEIFRSAGILMAVSSVTLPFLSDLSTSFFDNGMSKTMVFWILGFLLSGKTIASVLGIF